MKGLADFLNKFCSGALVGGAIGILIVREVPLAFAIWLALNAAGYVFSILYNSEDKNNK